MPRIERREAAVLFAVLLIGIGLRLYALSHSAVEHFDEGVYASNVYFGAPDYAYPQQRFYAPPLLPALIEAGMLAGLPPNLAALLPSLLAGCGTIAALWWFGRSWFSPTVGLAAAALAALSDFHIAYSAAALTDVLLGLWLVLAVDAIARSLVNGDYRWAIGAGIYTGLAWWTKYNGWLPLAIEAAALPLLWLVTQRQFLRRLSCFAVTAFTAALVWMPYYLSLQSQGGYGPIAGNHAKYVVGLSGWLDSAGRQIAAQQVMAGLIGAICLAIAAVAAPAGIAARLSVCFRAGGLDDAGTRQTVGTCLIAAWWTGLLVATPCYWPYPRLILPWLLATWLGAALGWHEAWKFVEQRWRPQGLPHWLLAASLPAALGCLYLLGQLLPAAPDNAPGNERRGYVQIAKSIHGTLPPSQSRAIYVYGEPALFFQLKALGEVNVGPVEGIPSESAATLGEEVPTYLIIGPHARSDPQFVKAWEDAQGRWEQVLSLDYRPGAIVWLDRFDPRKAKLKQQPSEAVEVYRLRAP
jgi:4-amino-4-deoxy-L-arabinose transferase-like glycosyltransferase